MWFAKADSQNSLAKVQAPKRWQADQPDCTILRQNRFVRSRPIIRKELLRMPQHDSPKTSKADLSQPGTSWVDKYMAEQMLPTASGTTRSGGGIEWHDHYGRCAAN